MKQLLYLVACPKTNEKHVLKQNGFDGEPFFFSAFLNCFLNLLWLAR